MSVRRSLAALLLSSSAPLGAADAPDWLRAAADAPLPGYGAKVPAAVLLDEGELDVEPSGRMVRTARFAVKVLNEDGARAAAARVDYGTDARKVESFDAWLIPAKGKTRRYGRKDAVDVSTAGGDVYNEARSQVISAAGEAEAGDVFGFEVVTEERPLFAQDVWRFQTSFPVRVSRYTVSLPAGWRAEGKVFNHSAVAPEVSGSRYTWQLRDLPHVQDEALRPPTTRLAPWLAVSFRREAAGAADFSSFDAWRDVSRWYSLLADPQGEPGAAVTAKARELTRDARSDFERVRAIARYVQAVNYIAVQIGIGRYRPHAADEVLAKAYGDCKDKANLMRALLKAVGVASHLVLVYSGDASFVREEWASPFQFNHCILAVRLTGKEDAIAVLDHETLGRLLFFDPTDPYTVLGDLPQEQQGSGALVAAGEAGVLLRLPQAPLSAKMLERSVEASLDADGALRAKVREVSGGQAAATERELFHGPRDELVRRLDGWVARGAAGARVAAFRHEDDEATGRFTLDLDLEAPRYAQVMHQRLLLFRPVIVNRREWTLPSEDGPRTLPVALEDEAFSESLRLALPPGFDVDELPEAVSVETPFGSYASKSEAAGGELRFTRRLEIRRSTVSAADHAAVRGFFDRVRAAEQAQVVLVRTR